MALPREDQIEQSYDKKFNRGDLKSAEQQAAESSGGQAGYDREFNDIAKNNSDLAALGEKEANPENPLNYSPSEKQEKKTGWIRKRAATALISVGLIGGGVGIGFLGGLGSMVVGLMENLTLTNDSSSVAQERRFLKVFGNAVGDPICNKSTKKIKCKMGRISNKALYKLEKKGVSAIPERTKRTGYPDKNPTAYKFTLDNGETRTVNARDITKFLSDPENRGYAAKVLGRGGAMNVRYSAWVGKYRNLSFWSKIGLKRDGGAATEKKELSDEERTQKREERIPSSDAINDAGDRVSENLNKRLEKAKKGGTAYMVAAAGCLTAKAPKLIAGAIAGVQLAQVASMVQDGILSPGSAIKGNAVENNITPSGINAVATTLTEQTPRESDGKLTSALDSESLKQALGINKNKTPVPIEYVPGGSALTNSAIQKGIQAEEKSEAACDKTLSPTTMYTYFALDSAVTVASSATVVGGIAKVVGSWVASEVVSKIASEVIQKLAPTVIKQVLESEKIPSAKGEALGDVLGVGAMTFFSSGGMTQHLPALKNSQLASYSKVKLASENFEREMDIASLSPFDTSSRYTFLGSILSNTRTAMVANGGYGGSFGSILSSFASIPRLSLSPIASANLGYSPEYCGYAKDFNIESDVAVNMAGMPCTGLTEQQAGMSTTKALDLMVSSGWVDDSKDIEEGWTIDDLMENDVIKPDTPLRDFVEECSDPTTGNYLFNSPGCSLDCDGNCSAIGTAPPSSTCYTPGAAPKDENGNQPCENEPSTVGKIENPSAISAMPVFLNDFQLIQAINGEDEDELESSTNSSDQTSTEGGVSLGESPNFGTVAFPLKGSKSVVNNPNIFKNGTTSQAGHPYISYDIYADPGTEVVALADGVVSYVSTDKCPGKFLTIWNEKAKLGVSYMHLSTHIANGAKVKAGGYVGKVGGAAEGCGTPHLHIDAGTNKIRQPCSREACAESVKKTFRDIGKILFETYQGL